MGKHGGKVLNNNALSGWVTNTLDPLTLGSIYRTNYFRTMWGLV